MVVDGEDRTVSTFMSIGPATPIKVFHNKATSFIIPNLVTTEALKDFIESHAELFHAVLDTFVGVEWDGNNHVGKWEETPFEEASSALQAALDGHSFETYWAADEWFQSDPLMVCADACQYESIERAAVALVNEASGDATLDVDDVERFLRRNLPKIPTGDPCYDKAQALLAE